jgi:macrolide-specific efflux system membrane fusion protein
LAFGQAATKIADGATDGPGGSGTWDVTDVAVSVGDTVTKDQVLAAADTASLRRDLAVAVADLNAAKTQRKVADTQLDDANTTAAKRQARIGRYNAMAQVTSAQSKVDDLRDQIARAKIIAPADGIVTSLDVSAGTTAPSTSAMTIDTGPIKATADVAEGDLPALAVGQPATVVVDAIDATLQGTVSSVAPAASTNSGGSVVTYAVVVDLTDVPADARPGMTADVTVVTEAANGVIAVPAAALQGTQGSYRVLVMGADGVPVSRDVTVGLVTASAAEIKSGLQAGESVVVGTTADLIQSSNNNSGFPGAGGGFQRGTFQSDGGGQRVVAP